MNEQDRVLGKPCFCKEYEYKIEEGKLTVLTKCVWFSVEDKIAYEKEFYKTYSKGATDYQTSKYRQIMVSLLKTDASSIPGLNGKALDIFKKYKNEIQNYYEFESAKEDWIKAMINETDSNILFLLNIELPVYYLNNVYEEALTQERILPLLFQNTSVLPFKENGVLKNQNELYIEFLKLGIDLLKINSIIDYLTNSGIDVRLITIRDIIVELLNTD